MHWPELFPPCGLLLGFLACPVLCILLTLFCCSIWGLLQVKPAPVLGQVWVPRGLGVGGPGRGLSLPLLWHL